MSPETKKLVSALGVAIAGAVLVVLGNWVPHLPEGVQVIAVSVLGAAAHYIDAFGHSERVDALVQTKVAAIVEQEK